MSKMKYRWPQFREIVKSEMSTQPTVKGLNDAV